MSDLQEMVRTRTITWEDPVPGARAGRTMSGLDYLKAIQEGRIPSPPIAILMDMRIDEVSEGRIVFSALPAEYHYNPLGTVHGGLAATLLDSALGCAVHSTLPAEQATQHWNQSERLAPDDARDRYCILRSQRDSGRRSHRYSPGPYYRLSWQTLCPWHNDLYHLASLTTGLTTKTRRL